MHVHQSDTDELSTAQCLALVSRARIGRLAFSYRALPFVVPMRFVVDGPHIVVQASVDSILAAGQGPGAIVAFEVDEIDPETGGGWSVMLTGRMREVTDGATIQRYELQLPDTRTGDQVRHFLRITPGLTSGMWTSLAAVATAAAVDASSDARESKTTPAGMRAAE